ncbi:MAG: hypothetical protein AB7I79_18270 [Rhizobiaceae bacterium]
MKAPRRTTRKQTDAAQTPVAVAAAVSPASPARKKTALPETTEGFPWPSNHEIKKESNPFTDRDWRMWLYAWAGLFVRLVIIFGASFTVVQFLSTREQISVQRSFELVDLWERDVYQAAQDALQARLAALNQVYAKDYPANPTQAEIDFYFRKLGDTALTAEGGEMPLPEFSKHFERIVYFLNRVSFCVTEGICAERVADAYFKDYARSFWSYFSGYVARQRKAGSPNFAEAIETYVKRGESDAPASR